MESLRVVEPQRKSEAAHKRRGDPVRVLMGPRVKPGRDGFTG